MSTTYSRNTRFTTIINIIHQNYVKSEIRNL